MFPLITHFQQLTRPQSAWLHIMQKPLVQRLQQLKQCTKLLEQSKNVSKSLDQLQLTFIDLARQVHHIQVSVEYDIHNWAPSIWWVYIQMDLERNHHPFLWFKYLLQYPVQLYSLHSTCMCWVWTHRLLVRVPGHSYYLLHYLLLLQVHRDSLFGWFWVSYEVKALSYHVNNVNKPPDQCIFMTSLDCNAQHLRSHELHRSPGHFRCTPVWYKWS